MITFIQFYLCAGLLVSIIYAYTYWNSHNPILDKIKGYLFIMLIWPIMLLGLIIIWVSEIKNKKHKK